MRVRPDMDYEDIPGLLTTAEAGVVVGKSQSAIQEMIRQEKLAARKIGGEYRIKKADLFVGAV